MLLRMFWYSIIVALMRSPLFHVCTRPNPVISNPMVVLVVRRTNVVGNYNTKQIYLYFLQRQKTNLSFCFVSFFLILGYEVVRWPDGQSGWLVRANYALQKG